MVTFNPKALLVTAAFLLALFLAVDGEFTAYDVALDAVLTLGALSILFPDRRSSKSVQN